MTNDPSQCALPGPLHLLALAALGLLIHLGSAWHAEFLNFDDPRFFGAAGVPSELAAAGFAGALDPTRTIVDAYLPVSHVSLLLDRALFGWDPRAVHLHALLLHLLCAVVLARLLGRLGLRAWPATLAAAVFLVHPALVESALWASSRKDLLSGLFGFLALSVVAARARGRVGGGAALGGAAILALLACYAKGTALVIGPLACVVTWLLPPREAGARRDWRPALAATVVCALATVHHALLAAGAGTLAAGQAAGEGGLWARLDQVPGAFVHYLDTALWPTRLNVLYPEVATREAFAASVVSASLRVLLFAAALGIAARSGLRPAVAGLAWFALALLPFNTALPATSLAAADRYLYLALPGLALAAASLGRYAAVVLAVALLPLGWIANDRAQEFRSSEALWQSSLAVDPANSAASYNLAFDRLQRGAATLSEADELFAAAEEHARYPNQRYAAADARRELAELRGRPEEAAAAALRAAKALEPLPLDAQVIAVRVRAHLQASRLLRRTGHEGEAVAQLSLAMQLDPDAPRVLAFRASALLAELLSAALRPVPTDAPQLVEAHALLDRARDALRALPADDGQPVGERWTQVPDAYEILWVRGQLRGAAGQLLQAEKAFRRAIACRPRRAEAWLARVDLYLSQADMAAVAERHARAGLDAGVRDPRLRFRLATALFKQGRFDEAREDYEDYLRLRPDDEQARVDLAQVIAAIGYQRLYQLPPGELDELADRVLELDPMQPKGLLMKAVACRGDDPPRLLEALVLLRKAGEAMPGDAELEQLYAETLRDYGWQLKLLGDRDVAAYDAFCEFLRVAPPNIPTDAVRNAVLQRWRSLLADGQQRLIAGELDAAERAFDRCLVLRPDDRSPNLQLGMVLMQRQPPRFEAALDCFETAAAGQLEAGGDPSLALLYQLRMLTALGRLDEAERRGRAYLQDPPEAAAEDLLQRIEDWLDR